MAKQTPTPLLEAKPITQADGSVHYIVSDSDLMAEALKYATPFFIGGCIPFRSERITKINTD